jgi:hypothetical protein
MDMTYEEYIEYINHLVMQEFLDCLLHFRNTESTVDSLTIL